jgi:hypothetical protein
MSLRRVAIACIAAWVVVWVTFTAMRLSSFDFRYLPGIGPVLLAYLVISFLAPIVATVLAIAALVREPRLRLNWLVLGFALAALFIQNLVFVVSRWL